MRWLCACALLFLAEDVFAHVRTTFPKLKEFFQSPIIKEIHNAGPLAGWTVEQLPDSKGRLGKIRVSGGLVLTREFGVEYDSYSRLWKTTYGTELNPTTPEFTATYTPDSTGRFTGLTRGVVNTSWSYNATNNRLEGITNDNTATNGQDFNFAYSSYDAQHRIKTRQADYGIGWSNITYDSRDQVTAVTLSDGRNLAYNYDAAGNRISQTNATLTPNALNQVTARVLSPNSRSFGLYGSVHPDATLKTFHEFTPTLGTTLSVTPVTGVYAQSWNILDTWNGGAVGRIDALVRGTLAGAGANGTDAIAEETVSLIIPPVNEGFVFDGGGRMREDAMWNYMWDGAGRLTRMVRKAGTLPPVAIGESVEYVHDADGRMTQRTHTVNYQGRDRVEQNTILWAGSLRILEITTKDGQPVDKKWYQWGADLSGSLNGAVGTGGLAAIIEEKAFGGTRTLIPVQDGIGHVVAVINNADGKTVTRFQSGPFGEDLGSSGETKVCPFRWHTQYYDEVTGLYLFPLRPYSPRLGGWLSRDPLGEAGGFNLYSMCEGDPINNYDWMGLEKKKKKKKDGWERWAGRLEKLVKLQSDGHPAVDKFASALMQDDYQFKGGVADAAHDLALGILDIAHAPMQMLGDAGKTDRRMLFEQIMDGDYNVAAQAWNPGANPRHLGNLTGGELVGMWMQRFGSGSPVPSTQIRAPRLRLEQPMEASAQWAEALRQSRQILDRTYAEFGAPDIAFGTAVRRAALTYEEMVRLQYGNSTLSARQYQVVLDGTLVNGVADSVMQIGPKRIAIEAKYVENWTHSLRNPASSIGNKPFALKERATMLQQSRKYSAAFDEVVYHSNSHELITYYSELFEQHGLKNIRFVHTQ